ncbi:MAG: pilus assembly protein [Myxococcota bacterium]
MSESKTQKLTSLLLWVVFSTAIAMPSVAGDEDIFTAQVPPNVLLMMDNSGSMNALMEHASFDAANYTSTCQFLTNAGGNGYRTLLDESSPQQAVRRYCWNADTCMLEIRTSDAGFTRTPDPTDHPDSGFIERTFCGQTRKLYFDGINADYGNRTWIFMEYANWLFDIDVADTGTLIGPADGQQSTAAEIVAEIDDDDNGQNYITGDTFAKYQITRMTAARDIARDVIYQTNSDCPAFLGDCGVYEDRVRFGIAQFHRNAHGGFVSAPIEAYSTNQADIQAATNSLDASTSTPLSETLFKLYTYFMPRVDADMPSGVNSSVDFPRYQYDDFDGDPASGSSIPDDPIIEECQKNFIIMVTDGSPTGDNFGTSGTNTRGFSDFRNNLIGDYYTDDYDPADPLPADLGPGGSEEGAPPWEFSSGTGYLDDIADFMQTNDCRPDYPNTVNVVDVYTVGFTTTGAVNSLLAKTAERGNGLYFSGNQADELTEALVNSVQDIISKSQGFSAATVPAARTADGGQLYTTLFQPTSARPFWPGRVRSYQITVDGQILDANGNCALTDLADPTFCAGGTFLAESVAPPYWNSSNEMPGANSRNLKVSLPGTSTQIVSDFDHSVTAAELGSSLGDVSDYPPAGTISAASDLDEAVVAFAAGCEWGTGMTAGTTDDFEGCVDRTRVEDGSTVPDRLGDIFHSNPVVIGPPSSFIEEQSYGAFTTTSGIQNRDRVIVAGANDGFLHGFHAGDYVTATGLYDAGTGEEVFGFMPWDARSKIADLAKDDATLHPISVDGSPAVADVWIDRNNDVDDAKVASEWKTVLVTGMRSGGEQYLALDMTDPSDANYPGYMWEFPLESDSFWRTRIGETWSQPVITRVRMERGSGDVEELWVAVFGFGYDATSDPNNAALYDTASVKGRGIMMLDIETGRPVAVHRYGSTTGGTADMYYAMPSTPGVLDYDQDGFADLIYIGDLGGNIWKWVVRDYGTANPTAAQLHQPNWSFRKFFDADVTTVTTSGGADRARSFYFSPSATIVGGVLYLGIGSGERSDLNCSSTLNGCSLLNRFYVLKDRDIWDTGTLSAIDGREEPTGDLTNVTTDEAACPAIEPKGYFFEVADGEKFVTNSEVFNSFFFISTYTPDLSNACEPAGEAELYGFLARCGQGYFGATPAASPIAGSQRSLDIGKGMPTDARLSIAPGGGGNRLIISKQDGELISIDAGTSSSEHGTLYWRELD